MEQNLQNNPTKVSTKLNTPNPKLKLFILGAGIAVLLLTSIFSVQMHLSKRESFDNKVSPSPTIQVTSTECVIGGCSGELCVKKGEDVASICIWKEEFACFKNATCEVQSNGECGWTQTPELKQCIQDSN